MDIAARDGPGGYFCVDFGRRQKKAGKMFHTQKLFDTQKRLIQ